MAVINIVTAFDDGDMVYLKTDPYQYRRIVVGIEIIGGVIAYILAIGGESSSHMEIEIATEADQSFQTEQE